MSDLLQLELELSLANLRAKFADDQPRDDHGRWTSGDGSGSSSKVEMSFIQRGEPRPPGQGGYYSVIAKDADGDPVGKLNLRDVADTKLNGWTVQFVQVSESRQSEGIARDMALYFHETHPDTTLIHWSENTDAGRGFAAAMIRDYPEWNRQMDKGEGIILEDPTLFDYGPDLKKQKYADDQPRDDHGRFTDGGGAGSGSGGSPGSSDRLVADNLGWDERIAWAKENFHQDEVEAKLTERETATVQGYVGSGFEHLNDAIRFDKDVLGNPLTALDKRDMQDLDSAISKSTVPQDMTLFRGVQTMDGLVPGTTYTDKAYLSTSLDHVTAEGFGGMGDQDEGAGGYVVELDVPKGSNGLYISDNLSASDGEFEVLLPRNTSFVIDSVDDASGTVKAHVV